jgi:hypothetical protein
MFMRSLFCLIASVAASWAQLPGGIPIPFELVPGPLRQFLQLTDDQVRKISQNNREFQEFAALKERRAFQVKQEIAAETAREPLNPGALGARYVELEVIRREIADKQKQLRPANIALLTEAQKMRLQALEEARRLQPVVAMGQSVNLVECEDFRPVPGISGGVTDFSSILLGFSSARCGGAFARIVTPILPIP